MGKQWKNTCFVALLSLSVAGQVEASISTNSSVTNYDIMNGDGHANAYGDMLVKDLNQSWYLSAYEEPLPGHIGHFEINLVLFGDYLSPDDNPEELEVWSQNPLSVYGSAQPSSIEWFNPESGQEQTYSFAPVWLNWDARSDLQLPNEWLIEPSGSAFGHAGVTGGIMTHSSINVYENTWDGEEPEPSWFNDFQISMNFGGVLTGTPAIVPEPATATLGIIGAVTAGWCRKRRRDLLPS